MSLISSKDRELAIEALEFYSEHVVPKNFPEKESQLLALINWLKLEQFKKGN